MCYGAEPLAVYALIGCCFLTLDMTFFAGALAWAFPW
jgi:hypothetical protein